jgi:hypothetical protein
MAVKLRQRRWRGIFGDDGRLLGIIEQVGTRWHAYAGGQFVGIAEAAETAAALIEDVNSGVSDEPRG